MGHEPSRRPNYGVDAPVLVRGFFVAAAAALTACLASAWSPWPGGALGATLALGTGLAGCYAAGMGLLMVYWSRVKKVHDRERLLDLIPWHGGEAVLDVGCGRGLLLVAAARRVPDGGAVGVDLWRAADQGGNGPDAALENADREGVRDRVRVETGDARGLACPDEAFDVVTSHWVVHNIPDAGGRERAVREMARVLRPGGWLVLADIRHHDAYASILHRLGFADVRREGPGWLGRAAAVLSGGSFVPAAVVAQKPVSRPHPNEP